MRSLLACFCVCVLVGPSFGQTAASIVADPATIELVGPGERYTLLVHGKTAAGFTFDATREATFVSSDPAIAEVNARGVVFARKNGTARIRIEVRNAG